MDLVQGVKDGIRRPIARLITLLERGDPTGHQALQELHHLTGRAHIIGITGSPGTGKSTLTDRLIEFYRRQDKRVGVIAVDPSSPFSGGAILGDRIRMQSRSGDPGVFIRSMGSRGTLGGLSSHTNEAVQVMDAAGFDIILVETVGVGQAEVDIVRLADTVLVVMVPNLGDDVQAVKAGIMEIADVFIVNKADLSGADKVHAEVEASMGLAHPEEGDWWQPIVHTIAERGEGVLEAAEAIAKHRAWSESTGAWHARRHARIRQQIRAHLASELVTFAFTQRGEAKPEFEHLVAEARDGTRTPRAAAEAIVARFKQA